MLWGIISCAALLGVLTGIAGRRVLAQLDRGVWIRAGPLEGACAVLFATVAWRALAGDLPSWWVPVPVVLAACGVPLAAVDFARLRLPDALTLPTTGLLGLVLAVAAMGAGRPTLALFATGGAAAFFAVHLLIHRLRPMSLGGGDVKLAAGLGGVLGAIGWPALAVGACLAAVVTLVLAAAGRAFGRRKWRRGVPHGPGLLAATWLLATFPGTGLGVGS